VFEDAETPGRYVESFLTDSWVEHLRQHQRTTLADKAVQDAVGLGWARRACAKVAARQVLELLRRRLPPEQRIAMRLPAEPRDDVAVPARLRRRVLEQLSELRRCAGGELLGERYSATKRPIRGR
jgi:Transmembrane secretion effector